jgi:iron complex transport system permease protein
MRRPLAISLFLLAGLILLALCMGRYPITPLDLFDFAGLFDGHRDPIAVHLLWQSRLPRVLAAVLIGAGLACAGASFQAVFRNPLVSPDLLGVLAGSGFGAALAILIGLPPFWRMAVTFIGGVVAVSIGIMVSRLFGGRDERDGGLLLLLFGGLLSGALFTALLSLAKYVADPDSTLADIVFWLLGSLAGVNGHQLMVIGLPLGLVTLVLVGCGRFLDFMVLPDDEAISLGVPIGMLRLLVIALATTVCALTVAMAGTIGWLGLVVPHLVRLLVGPAHRVLMPVTACAGAAFLLAADTVARSATPSEIPIGILTDLIGVVLFLAILPCVRRGWV